MCQIDGERAIGEIQEVEFVDKGGFADCFALERWRRCRVVFGSQGWFAVFRVIVGCGSEFNCYGVRAVHGSECTQSLRMNMNVSVQLQVFDSPCLKVNRLRCNDISMIVDKELSMKLIFILVNCTKQIY